MPTPLLIAKLWVPPGEPQSAARPRLVAQLDRGQGRKLTLLCAPAGFG